MSRASGVTDAQLAALPTYRDSDAFSAVERTVLDYAVAMTECPVVVSDALFQELLAALGHAALVELTSAIAWENFRARFNRGFGIEAEGFTEGAACPVHVAAPAARDGARAGEDR